MRKIDRQAMELCQAVHTSTSGRPQRWISLHTVRLTLGLDLDQADEVARHAAGLGWLVLNAGPELHSVAIGPKLHLQLAQ